jgi:MFS family permease
VLTAGSIYVAGACLGALFFGQLTDRFGRKKLFLATLLLYLVATVATAFAGSVLYFYIARFFTGAGIGGEYAAINSAIDELIPARVRGRVDLIINGSYWLGAAGGALGALVLLDTSIFAPDLGWRLAFVIGAVLGIGILLVRRHVPESPRWLFIHGRDEEADRIVGEIEKEVERESGESLDEPGDSITVSQRKTISFGTIASTAFKRYPGAPPSASRCSSARRSSTTRSRSASARSWPSSTTSTPAGFRSTSRCSRSPTSSGRCCSAGCSTRSAASR